MRKLPEELRKELTALINSRTRKWSSLIKLQGGMDLMQVRHEMNQIEKMNKEIEKIQKKIGVSKS